MTKSTIHLPLPKRAGSIEGKEPQAEKPIPSESGSDTVTQDATMKINKIQREGNALVAELDQGPLGA